METISIQLKPDTIAEVDRLREQNTLKPRRAQYIRSLIEQHVEAVTGKSRSEALIQIAVAGLAESSSDLSRDAFDKFSTPRKSP